MEIGLSSCDGLGAARSSHAASRHSCSGSWMTEAVCGGSSVAKASGSALSRISPDCVRISYL